MISRRIVINTLTTTLSPSRNSGWGKLYIYEYVWYKFSTNTFAILEFQNTSRDVPEKYKTRLFHEPGDLKLWKGRSGRSCQQKFKQHHRASSFKSTPEINKVKLEFNQAETNSDRQLFLYQLFHFLFNCFSSCLCLFAIWIDASYTEARVVVVFGSFGICDLHRHRVAGTTIGWSWDWGTVKCMPRKCLRKEKKTARRDV